MNKTDYSEASDDSLKKALEDGDFSVIQEIVDRKKIDLLEDSHLMHQFQNGNLDCFNILYERNKRKIIRYIYLMVNDRFVADDLAQEVWMKIIDKRNLYESQGSTKFLTWAYRVARNYVIDFVRQNETLARGRNFQFLDFDAPADDGIPLNEKISGVTLVLPQDDAEDKKLINEFQSCMGGMEYKFRDVLFLHLDGVANKDLVGVFGLTEGAIRARIKKGQVLLTTCMQSKGYFMEVEIDAI